MRKHLLSLTALLFIGIFTQAQNDIPNQSFESWDADTSVMQVIYWSPVNWSTPNEFIALAGMADKLVVTYDLEAYTGDTCARLESKEITIFTFSMVAPGTITLGTFNIDKINFTGSVSGGIPFTQKPTKMKGYWKYTPVESDSGMAAVILTKWNTETSTRDTIGEGLLTINREVSEWTEFEVEIGYMIDEDPDTMNVIMMSSDIMNGFEGSLMLVDDLSLELNAGLTYDLMPRIAVSIYPNPANDYAVFELAEIPDEGLLKIFDARGQLISIYQVNDKLMEVSTSEFDQGTYFYQLFDGLNRMNSGSFVVN